MGAPHDYRSDGAIVSIFIILSYFICEQDEERDVNRKFGALFGTLSGEKSSLRVLALRMSVGVAGGICVPISEAFQGRSVLYLSGRGFDRSAESILALQLLAQHFAARAWALSEHTVNDYITSSVTKLHAPNRTEAVLRALLTNQMDLP